MIAVVDYEAGNLASVRKALETAGAEVMLVRRAEEAGGAHAIVVPGVGHFGATAPLGDDWRVLLRAHVAAGRPILGICLGMQWLFEASEEAPGQPGLGVFPGTCHRLGRAEPGVGPEPAAAKPSVGAEPAGAKRSVGAERRLRPTVKVPHVGWNSLEIVQPSRALAGVPPGAYVYFTHSYAAPVTRDCVAVAWHGERFAAFVERGALWGAQFHPEKSGEVGLQVLRNFVAMARQGEV